jgi:hypothetical protein
MIAWSPECALLFDMQVIARRQDQERCASITCMIRHYVARRAKVTEGHPHNAAYSARRAAGARLSLLGGLVYLAIDAIVAVYFAASESKIPGLIVRSADADGSS